LCNKEIKFAAFWDYAHSCLGAEKIATGHYARIAFDGERHSLLKGVDERKDQSYFLSFLSEKQLAKAIFPLGEMQKSEVRQIAGKLGLSVAGKKDSTGICFIGERNFREFLSRYLPAQKGDIIDADSGEKIGEHNGLMYYTIGQRKGLGIGNRGGGERWYVVSKELESNVLFAAEGEANPRLFSSGFTSGEVHFVNPMRPQIVRCTVKHRYMQAETPASVRIQPNHVSVAFDAPQAGVAPGQVGAFYMNETCLGGAIIGKSIELAQN
jgi:tRNA-specific 2-thiouridylase